MVNEQGMLDGSEPAWLFLVIVPFLFSTAVLVAYPLEQIPFALFPFFTHFLAWLPASYYQTEKYFDLTFATTFLCLQLITFLYGDYATLKTQKIFCNCLFMIWAIRLGWYLFERFLRRGRDFRHPQIKTNPSFNLFAHMAQALWVYLVGLPLWIINLSSATVGHENDFWLFLGVSTWVLGMAMEVIADSQKTQFLSRCPEKNTWIQEGLWRYCKHPNYGGEILMSLVNLFVVFPSLNGWSHIAVISPPFTALFLYFTSHKLLEGILDAKFAKNPKYLKYKQETWCFLPNPALIFSKNSD